MRFFYLAHSIMSLECLKGLAADNMLPGLAVIHNSLDRKKLDKEYYTPVKEFCIENRIELSETDDVNELKNKLSEFDTGVCVGFMSILKKKIFSIPKNGILNLHCGKLPEYRGRAPISRSIMNGEEFLTVTVHRIDEGIDSGDICKEYKIKISQEDDVNTLYRKCSGVSSKIISECLRDIKERKLIFRKQITDKSANKVISDEERRINWNENANAIFNTIRALTFPYPCAYFSFNNKKYLILKSIPLSDNLISESTAGTVTSVSDTEMEIETGRGRLNISVMTDENLNEINFKEQFKTGDIFN
ncbi:MAG: hypothetical protein IPM38_02885 [Ignavibacteria bacterium]|nr:hypothetical protein [Ignavibacteria bacterium]